MLKLKQNMIRTVVLGLLLTMLAATSLLAAEKVNINSAGAKELAQLKGIGPALAQRIVQYRQANGSFNSVDDLLKVRGIGKLKLAKIKARLSTK